jgi:hypothetical protein
VLAKERKIAKLQRARKAATEGVLSKRELSIGESVRIIVKSNVSIRLAAQIGFEERTEGDKTGAKGLKECILYAQEVVYDEDWYAPRIVKN